MKIIIFIIGLLSIIIGFLLFSSIGISNEFSWMNYSIHILITISGFILIFIGIISMFIFEKEEEINKKIDSSTSLMKIGQNFTKESNC